jgi:hypothetical protein
MSLVFAVGKRAVNFVGPLPESRGEQHDSQRN